MAELHVTGLAELQKLLDTLPAKLEANVMRGALRAGANVIKGAARENINSHSGELASSLKVTTRSKGGVVMATISAGKGFGKKGTPPGNLPLWVEYGTKPHWIAVNQSARPGRMVNGSGISGKKYKPFSVGTLNKMAARGSLIIGLNFIGESCSHPGATPRPFMRTAMDSQAQNAVVAAAEYIKKRLATKEGLDTADINIGVEE